MEPAEQIIDLPSPLPWDERERIGFLKAFFISIKEILLTPADFFRRLKSPDALTPPLIFYVTVLGLILTAAVSLSLLFKPEANAVIPLIIAGSLLVGLLVGALFVSAFILHLFVMILGGEKGFKVTFAILAYSAATSVFYLVPVVGVFIQFFWGMVITIKGLRQLQKLSLGKAVGAYLLPTIIVIVIVAGVFAFLTYQFRSHLADSSGEPRTAEAYLKNISRACEEFSGQKNGRYPAMIDELTEAGLISETENICGGNVAGYIYKCAFSQEGYEITAIPVIVGKTGATTMTIKTGGVLTPTGFEGR